MRCNQNKISEVLKFMQVCIDTLKEYGLIVEKDGKLFLEISEAEKTKRKGQRKCHMIIVHTSQEREIR